MQDRAEVSIRAPQEADEKWFRGLNEEEEEEEEEDEEEEEEEA